MRRFFLVLGLLALSGLGPAVHAADQVELLNLSYDPTRELYQDINQAFALRWKAAAGQDLRVRMSHGGSGKQARSVIDGLGADVVTLALAFDIDEIARRAQLLPIDWQQRLPNNSAPYYSTVVFLVRKGNPKGIQDWDDLVKPGLQVITPNPKTSGGARWNYLAAWGYALGKYGDEKQALDFVSRLYRNVPVLDSGARAATMTFVQRGLGDVLLAWENEAFQAIGQLGDDKFDIVLPSVSVLAEPPVALIDKNVDQHGTRAVAEAYLKFLYSPEAQEIIAKRYYRPRLESVASKYASVFRTTRLLSIDADFGGWAKAQAKHFNNGALFDQIFAGQR